MPALYRAGRRVRALEVHRALRHELSSRPGLEPSPRTSVVATGQGLEQAKTSGVVGTVQEPAAPEVFVSRSPRTRTTRCRRRTRGRTGYPGSGVRAYLPDSR
ncbi:BTAD domain-containing putative transcriptional regulator [Streptomyces kutzneri]|uniref:BTAD domain-containing putative transcriptional regulator n=1 Tax=Streptomyces kutzneri TaxID=3051179 RepID=UPI0028D605BC|nr:BTAD domain-containing putative transcriptional regulator [Streptomyces sp. DSM 40907]